MRTYTRPRLIGEIAREIAEILEFEVKDPVLRAAAPTVMAVELPSSGEEATVSVAVALEDRDRVLAAFARDRGFFRTRLARRLAVRRVPRLTCVLDETLRDSRPGGLPGRGWDA